ncbi:MAG: GDP-mannose 4,6-dehydratase [Chloroflexota bacterium]
MRVLITGASGFVGGHLARHLLAEDPTLDIHGTTLPSTPAHSVDGVMLHAIDLRRPDAVRALIARVRPGHIYHLAAQASVRQSFDDPWETLENNIRAQLNVIKACLDTGITPRILVVSSAEVYFPQSEDDLPLTESAELHPTSPYSVSKIAQDMLGLQYAISHGLPIMRARPFNHFGPGQSPHFVAPAFGLQIARIEAGAQEPVIHVGDLSARRDFTDVRDIVRAYRLIVEHGLPGDVYNIASNQTHSIQELLDALLAQSDVRIEVAIDPDRLRPSTIPVLRGSYDHLNAVTGWEPAISFDTSLADIMADCRTRVAEHV